MNFNGDLNTPSQPLGKTVVTAEIYLSFCINMLSLADINL
jgi:hypothetical protein